MNNDLYSLYQILGAVTGEDDWFFDETTNERKIKLLEVYKENLSKIEFDTLQERLLKGLNLLQQTYSKTIEDINGVQS